MYNFRNDYGVIAHPKILERLMECNDEVNIGYGLDKHSINAAKLIKNKLRNDNIDVHFLIGGTSANKTVLAHCLKPYEAIIACETAHINVHETGAIEANGHKIITAPSHDGKMDPKELEEIYNQYVDEHMVKPKLVYISNSTETGTIYFLDELEKLHDVCQKLGLLLFIDGARLGSALTSFLNDVKFENIPNLCDVFYIGGTKNGAMLGEAVCIVNDSLKENFRYSIKQNGGMYSKGFVAGIQFEVLFENDLYFENARHANLCGLLLKEGLEDLGLKIAMPAYTNQIFVELNSKLISKLEKIATFEVWNKKEKTTIVRFVTSFITSEEEISSFLIDFLKIIDESHDGE